MLQQQEEPLPCLLTAAKAKQEHMGDAGPKTKEAEGGQGRTGDAGPSAQEEPSDLQASQRVMTPEEKAGEVKCGFEGANARVGCAYLHDLEFQLLKSKYWSGVFCKDYFFFVCNWHPFLGMFLSHPCHPWSKMERLLMTFVSCALTVLPSANLVRWGQDSGGAFLSSFAIFTFITLPVGVLEAMLYWLAIGNIFCRGGRCDCCASCVDRMRNHCFGMSLLVSVVSLALSYKAIGDADLFQLVRPLLLSRLQSYLIWFPLGFLMPCVGFPWVWKKERDSVPRSEVCQLSEHLALLAIAAGGAA